MTESIRISVITPTFNRVKTLGRAIESVLSQKMDGVEHIIVDAASTDGTAELLLNYPHLTVISEPDRGIYDGMNKGLNMAQGDLLVILNSDDFLMPGALAAWLTACDANPQADIVSGGAQLVDLVSGDLLQSFASASNTVLDGCEALLGLPIINARAIKRTFWKRLGGFELNFPLLADREWLIRAVLAGARNVITPNIVYSYQSHAKSATYAAESPTEKRLAYAQESAALAAWALAMKPPSNIARAARILSDKSCAMACYLAFKSASPKAFWAAVCQGFGSNLLWPCSIAAILLARWLRIDTLREHTEGCPKI